MVEWCGYESFPFLWWEFLQVKVINVFRLGKIVKIWFLKNTKIFSSLSVYESDNILFIFSLQLLNT